MRVHVSFLVGQGEWRPSLLLSPSSPPEPAKHPVLSVAPGSDPAPAKSSSCSSLPIHPHPTLPYPTLQAPSQTSVFRLSPLRRFLAIRKISIDRTIEPSKHKHLLLIAELSGLELIWMRSFIHRAYSPHCTCLPDRTGGSSSSSSKQPIEQLRNRERENQSTTCGFFQPRGQQPNHGLAGGPSSRRP